MPTKWKKMSTLELHVKFGSHIDSVTDQLYALAYMDGWNRTPYPPKGGEIEKIYWMGYEDGKGDSGQE